MARNDLSAFEDLFLLQTLSPHEGTTGGDILTFSDTGLRSFSAGGVIGAGLQLSFLGIAD